MFGGTGLDFLYGNGGGGVSGDTLYTARGTVFGAGENPYGRYNAWKEYAKQTDAVWYSGPNVGTTNNADTIKIGYNDDTSNPVLIGRHYAEVNNNIWVWTANSPVGSNAKDNSNQTGNPNCNELGGTEKIGGSEEFFDVEGMRYSYDAATGTLRRRTPESIVGDSGATRKTDIVGTILPPEGDFLAILVDTLDGDDTIEVSPTVQKSVWIDAGRGNDTINVQPTLVFLPDQTDPIGNRNSTNAYDFGTIVGDYAASGLTIDSAASSGGNNSEVDVYRFTLDTKPASGDRLSVTPQTSQAVVNPYLWLSLYSDSTLQTLTSGTIASGIDLGAVAWTNGQSNTFFLKVVSNNSVKTDYELSFKFASTPDELESGDSPNDSAANAHLISSPSTTSSLQDLTLPSLARATQGDWLKLTTGSPSDTVQLVSYSPSAAVTLDVFDATGVNLLKTIASGAASTVGSVARTYLLPCATATGPARYDLNLGVTNLSGTGNDGTIAARKSQSVPTFPFDGNSLCKRNRCGG